MSENKPALSYIPFLLFNKIKQETGFEMESVKKWVPDSYLGVEDRLFECPILLPKYLQPLVKEMSLQASVYVHPSEIRLSFIYTCYMISGQEKYEHLYFYKYEGEDWYSRF